MSTRLILIRHAPAHDGGRLAGRRDVEADLSDSARLARLRDWLDRQKVAHVITSPARRCRQTARALWPARQIAQDARLWEQDFGAWEGMPYPDLPDLGPLSRPALAAYCPPGGESFDDLCARVGPALAELRGVVAVIAHAGVIRAALGLGADGLGFSVAPLSVTMTSALPGAQRAILCVNQEVG